MSCLQLLYSWSDCLWICFNTVLHRAVSNGLNFHCFLSVSSQEEFRGIVQACFLISSWKLSFRFQLSVKSYQSVTFNGFGFGFTMFEIGWVAKLVGDWFGFGFTTLNWKPLIFLGNLTLLVSLLVPRDNNHTILTRINTNHSYLIVTSYNPEKHTLCHYSQST